MLLRRPTAWGMAAHATAALHADLDIQGAGDLGVGQASALCRQPNVTIAVASLGHVFLNVERDSKGADVGVQVEGVGTGALAAAVLHADFDLDALATWAPGKPVPFEFLAATFEEISEESKRHAVTRLLTNAFRAILATTPADLLPAVYLCVNQARPRRPVLSAQACCESAALLSYTLQVYAMACAPPWPPRRSTRGPLSTSVSIRRAPG